MGSNNNNNNNNNVYRGSVSFSSSSLIGTLLRQQSSQQQQQQQLHDMVAVAATTTTPRSSSSSSSSWIRVALTLAVCAVVIVNLVGGPHILESIWGLGVHGWNAQRLAHQGQAQLLQLHPSGLVTTKVMKEKKGTIDMDVSNKNTTTAAAVTAKPKKGCETTIMLIRHCEKGNLKSHCSFMGYERSVYLASLFGDNARWPVPAEIYALADDRTHKLNFREVETVAAIADQQNVPVDRTYAVTDTKALANHLLNNVLEGSMCGKLVLVSWKHSDIPRLAHHLGCGPLEGCPWDYKGKDFDSTWQIRYVFFKYK
jgi:hypothetical protein